ncbi:MAG: hypothetical protein ACU85V_13455, partial [Gammaproteobacteria bacterium]
MQPNTAPTNTPAAGPDVPTSSRAPLLSRLSAAIRTGAAPMRCLTVLHPCFVDGARTLVFRRGLAEQQPGLFRRLREYAAQNGFSLLEDRRKRELGCRDERRRLAPVLMFAAGLVANAAVAADGELVADGQAVVPTIEIIGERARPERREYLNVGGKRFVSQPYGEVETILGVAAEVRAQGEYHRVRTRGLKMPSEYTDTFIDRYDYTMPGACGGKRF